MDDHCLCDICFQSIETTDKRTVYKRGIQNLIKCSKERMDDKWIKWLTKEKVELHTACYLNFVSKPKIAAAKKRKLNENLSEVQEISSSSTSSSISESTVNSTTTFEDVPQLPETDENVINFDFNNLCFICGEVCNVIIELKKSKHRRCAIRTVNSECSWIKQFLEACEKNENEYFSSIKERITSIDDLSTVGAKYHLRCRQRCCQYLEESTSTKSIEEDLKFREQYDKLLKSIEESEKSQWTFCSLCDMMGNPAPTITRLKSALIETYGDDVFFTARGSQETVITFKENVDKILLKNFRTPLSVHDEENSKEKIIKLAAEYIREDIRSLEVNTKVYPASTDFFSSENIEGVIPDSLRMLLESITLPNKKSLDRSNRKITAIAHAIISATRPTTFISSLQLSLALYIHANLQSKILINILNKLGYCISYSETITYEGSAVLSPTPLVQPTKDSFVQFVFDNADYDIATIDGKNTFHYTGGIECITPKNTVQLDKEIPRCTAIRSSDIIAKHQIPVHEYKAPGTNGLSLLEIEDIRKVRPLKSSNVFLLPGEIVWAFGRWLSIPQHPGWNGFMEIHTSNLDSSPSRIKCLPFIYLKATDNSSLYSAMIFAVQEAQKVEQKNVFLTFDQQLYIKARQILSEIQNNLISCPYDMSKTHIRLGGFHLLMSFLGCIGKIMIGSGLKEAWSEIYAEKSTEHMMTGKNYSRSLRAKFLTETSLLMHIFQECVFSDTEKQQIHKLISLKPDRQSTKSTLDIIENSAVSKILITKVEIQIEEIKKRGNTASLWIQYIKMVSLIRSFIHAERSGNFNLHLSTIIEMIPFFHSCNHYNYAKSAHLYVQDMLGLEEKMSCPTEFEKYTKQGFFTIRRNDKFFNGVSTDMIIEQTLMRSIHNIGGLSHGRSMTESVCTAWLNTLNCLTYIVEDLETFCDVSNSYSEQHKDFRDSVMRRDNDDLKTLCDWFGNHPPFPTINHLMSIATGVTSGPEVNCHDAERLGIISYEKIIPKETTLQDGSTRREVQYIDSVRLSQDNQISSIALSNGSITIGNIKYPIDEKLLFNRFQLSQPDRSQFPRYFKHEICPFPISIFTSACKMRHDNEDIFNIFQASEKLPTMDDFFIIDGDNLLSSITWTQTNTYENICGEYYNVIKNKFGNNTLIIFESEIDTSTHPKVAESMLASSSKICAEIFFDYSKTCTKKRDDFFSNYTNKLRFIDLIVKYLRNKNMNVIVTSKNMDFVKCIVDETKKLSQIHKNVIIWSNNIDVLCLLIANSDGQERIYFNVLDKIFLTLSQVIHQFEELAPVLHVIHAMTGCSSTSSFFQVMKKNVLKQFMKEKQNILPLLEIFLIPPDEINHSELVSCGEKIIIKMYKGFGESLDDLRCRTYLNALSQRRKKEFDFSTLPPTLAAALNHLYRVYWQIQTWLGHSLSPTEWGWNLMNDKMLIPFTTANSPIAEDLIGLIVCNCKKKCKPTTCSCMKSGLFCTFLCKNCPNDNCDNQVKIIPLSTNLMSDENDGKEA